MVNGVPWEILRQNSRGLRPLWFWPSDFPPLGISLVYRTSFTEQCVQQTADVNKVFLDCRLGPTLSCLVAEKRYIFKAVTPP